MNKLDTIQLIETLSSKIKNIVDQIKKHKSEIINTKGIKDILTEIASSWFAEIEPLLITTIDFRVP